MEQLIAHFLIHPVEVQYDPRNPVVKVEYAGHEIPFIVVGEMCVAKSQPLS